MNKNSTQTKVESREPKDPHIHLGVYSTLPSTGNNVVFRYREAFTTLDVIGDAFKDVKMSDRKRQRIDLAMQTCWSPSMRPERKLAAKVYL